MHKRKKYAIYSSEEKLLINLHKVATRSKVEGERSNAYSLISWFQRNNYWTTKQKHFAEALVSSFKVTKPIIGERSGGHAYCLYAVRISNGIKIGYTRDINKRLKTYKTGTIDVELVGTIELNTRGLQYAKNQEKALHRFLGKHKIEREIFTLSAREEFNKFKPKPPKRKLMRQAA